MIAPPKVEAPILQPEVQPVPQPEIQTEVPQPSRPAPPVLFKPSGNGGMQSKLDRLRQLTNEQKTDAPAVNETQEEEIPEENTPLTQEAFENVWKQYLAHLDAQSKMSLSVTYKDAQWQLLNDNEVELTLASKLENELFDEDRINILPFLRSRLKHFKLDFVIKVNQQIQVKRTFTAEDKFKAMAEKNPALNDLRNALGLELEY